MSSISAANAEFCLDVFKEVKIHRSNENVLFSSLSMLSTLALVYMGARGRTQSQMEKVSYPRPLLVLLVHSKEHHWKIVSTDRVLTCFTAEELSQSHKMENWIKNYIKKILMKKVYIFNITGSWLKHKKNLRDNSKIDYQSGNFMILKSQQVPNNVIRFPFLTYIKDKSQKDRKIEYF